MYGDILEIQAFMNIVPHNNQEFSKSYHLYPWHHLLLKFYKKRSIKNLGIDVKVVEVRDG